MRLNEFENGPTPNRVNPAEDKLNARDINDTRKPKLKLSHINKLRKMREIHKLDMADREKYWQVIYGIPAPEEELGPAPL